MCMDRAAAWGLELSRTVTSGQKKGHLLVGYLLIGYLDFMHEYTTCYTQSKQEQLISQGMPDPSDEAIGRLDRYVGSYRLVI